MRNSALIAAIFLCCSVGASANDSFDPKPWLQDLQQMHGAFSDKYANFDWAISEREVDLTALFNSARSRIEAAQSDADTRSAFDKLIAKLGDGHVEIEWPAHHSQPSTASAQPAPSPCVALGYDTKKAGIPIATRVSGYRPLADGDAPEFPAGTLDLGGRRIGFLRIGMFAPEDSPPLCEYALAKLSAPPTGPCDDACSDRVETAATARMTDDLELRLRQLKDAGAQILIVDITDNGGGSEWAEAAARIVSDRPLISERLGFVRGNHWIKKWNDLETALLQAAKTASPRDRIRLQDWAHEAEIARMEASTPCSSAAFWNGKLPSCDWLGHGYYATGLVGGATPNAFESSNWGPLVFTPAEFKYDQGVWKGPIAVLVDGNTWSAAEEFAAVLQDNKAAAVAGSPSGGAGCGHTDGGTPTTLSHSGGVLELPDCVRFRKDDRNEIGGIDPDVLIGFRENDGPTRKSLRLQQKLPEIVRVTIEGISR